MLPVLGFTEKTKPIPTSIADPIFAGSGNAAFAKKVDKDTQ